MSSPFAALLASSSATTHMPAGLMPPTDRQREVLAWVERFMQQEGMPPTRRDIGHGLGIRVNAVQEHLTALERKGFISIKEGTSRGIRVLNPTEAPVKKTAIQQTSLDAYEGLIKSGKLGKQEATILSFMAMGRDYSVKELCELTGLEVNAVSGRVSDLKKKQMLEEGERRPCEVTGNSIKPVRLVDSQQKLPL